MASHAALEVVSAVERDREVRLERRKLKVLSQLREESGAVTEEQLLSLSEDSSRLVEAMEDMVVGTCKCLLVGLLMRRSFTLPFYIYSTTQTCFLFYI